MVEHWPPIWWIWLPSSMIFHNVSSTLFLFDFWRVLWGVKHIHSFTVNFTPWASHLIRHPVEVPQSHGLTDHLSIFSWLAKISGSAIVKSPFRWWNTGGSNWNSHFSPLRSQFLLLKLPGLFQPGHIGEFLFQLHTGCFASSLHGCHEHGATSGTFGETQQHVEGPFATLGWTFMGWWAFDPSKSIKTRFLTKGNDPQWSVGWFWTKHNMEFWPTQMRFWPTNMGKQYNQPNTAKDYHRGCMTNIKGT